MEARRVQPRRAAWLVPAARAFAAALLIEVLDLGLLVRNVALLGRHLLGGVIGRRAEACRRPWSRWPRPRRRWRSSPAGCRDWGAGGLDLREVWDRERGLSAWWVYACYLVWVVLSCLCAALPNDRTGPTNACLALGRTPSLRPHRGGIPCETWDGRTLTHKHMVARARLVACQPSLTPLLFPHPPTTESRACPAWVPSTSSTMSLEPIRT